MTRVDSVWYSYDSHLIMPLEVAEIILWDSILFENTAVLFTSSLRRTISVARPGHTNIARLKEILRALGFKANRDDIGKMNDVLRGLDVKEAEYMKLFDGDDIKVFSDLQYQ